VKRNRKDVYPGLFVGESEQVTSSHLLTNIVCSLSLKKKEWWILSEKNQLPFTRNENSFVSVIKSKAKLLPI
jgi:hypothetical protein